MLTRGRLNTRSLHSRKKGNPLSSEPPPPPVINGLIYSDGQWLKNGQPYLDYTFQGSQPTQGSGESLNFQPSSRWVFPLYESENHLPHVFRFAIKVDDNDPVMRIGFAMFDEAGDTIHIRKSNQMDSTIMIYDSYLGNTYSNVNAGWSVVHVISSFDGSYYGVMVYVNGIKVHENTWDVVPFASFQVGAYTAQSVSLQLGCVAAQIPFYSNSVNPAQEYADWVRPTYFPPTPPQET